MHQVQSGLVEALKAGALDDLHIDNAAIFPDHDLHHHFSLCLFQARVRRISLQFFNAPHDRF